MRYTLQRYIWVCRYQTGSFSVTNYQFLGGKLPSPFFACIVIVTLLHLQNSHTLSTESRPLHPYILTFTIFTILT